MTNSFVWLCVVSTFQNLERDSALSPVTTPSSNHHLKTTTHPPNVKPQPSRLSVPRTQLITSLCVSLHPPSLPPRPPVLRTPPTIPQLARPQAVPFLKMAPAVRPTLPSTGAMKPRRTRRTPRSMSQPTAVGCICYPTYRC